MMIRNDSNQHVPQGRTFRNPFRALVVSVVVMTALSLVGATLAPAVAAVPPTAGSFRDGLWEMTIRTDVPGVKSMPPMVLKRCISAKEIQDLQAKATKPPGSDQCKVLEQTSTGATLSWKLECTGKVNMKGQGAVTATGDTYSMTSTMVMTSPEGKPIEIKSSMTGKRLGNCTP